MLENIKIFCHASIMFDNEKIIYIDPFRIDDDYHNADIIMITHDHYDHYSEEDIKKVKKEDTIIVVPEDLTVKTLKLGFKKENIIIVKPNEEYKIEEILFETIPAYNTNKKFHPKENNWVGYIITIDNIRYYIAGDIDITEESQKVKCDVAFVPVGGTYTMTFEEAARLVNIIKPKIAVPIHYGSIVGSKEDAVNFIRLLDSDIQGITLI